MIDIELVRKEPDRVRENLARRQVPQYLELFESLRARDGAWREVSRKAAETRKRRNELSRLLGEAKKKGEDPGAIRQEAENLPDVLGGLEWEETELAAERDRLLKRIPNLLDPTVPYGKDDSENQVVAEWGTRREAPAGLPSHGELLESLGLADFERARRASGAGFYYLVGPAVLLDLALQRYALDLLVQRGFIPVLPPYLLRREPYEGVTDLADFENVMYKIQDEDLYLIATSEHPLAALHMGEILEEDRMPIRLAGLSACFRKEIGGHGVDQKGVFRVHQFEKVEQFVYARPEDSPALHEEILKNAEDIFRGLDIAYRIVNVCTGDLGIVAAKKYDIEAWFPRQGKYREVVSCSNCTDYQSRRLGLRMGRPGAPGKRVPHTLNSTGVASPRAIAAVIENYAREDGTIEVPKVLQPYMGGLKEISKLPRFA